jgi:hypothetical protein
MRLLSGLNNAALGDELHVRACPRRKGLATTVELHVHIPDGDGHILVVQEQDPEPTFPGVSPPPGG